ncbi:MAG: S41 family peptidase [Saprospiraceae bacterium]|nr:S41 family peptidase [Saprospiraceae bacterium]
MEITKNIELFTNIYKELNYYYVDDIEPGKLMKTGIDAMLNTLDPYTNYFSEAQVETYRFSTEGKYHSIGAGIRMVDDLPTVTELFEESPAYKSGVRLGDQIMSVGGKSVIGKTKEEITTLMQGAADSNLDVMIKRPGESTELPFSITRGEVDVPNVPYSGMVSDKVGYINLTVFTDQAGSHVAAALQKLKKENPNMAGVILDLRDNGGGLLREAVNVCNVFIPRNELVVTTKGKVKEWDRSFKTMQGGVDENIPLTILVDKGTASASEIVSGVVQDLDRGVIIGQRTYGKGLVQNTREIGYNSQVKLTTAKYYIPSGRCIQGVEYENGVPKNIADSLRAEFKTKGGRKVLDGGGVKPDIVIDAEKMPEIVEQLIKDDILFKYATAYKLKHQEIKPLREFSFTEFEDFLKFVKHSGFEYKSVLTGALEAFKAKAMDHPQWNAMSKDFDDLNKRIKEDPDKLLVQYKELIVKNIEKEIIPRYYLQKGKIEKSLQVDQEIQDAISVLDDQAKYRSILNGESAAGGKSRK